MTAPAQQGAKHLPNPDHVNWTEPRSLTEALIPEYGSVRAAALAKAYEEFCDHGNRDRFESEKRRIKSCRLIALNGREL